MGSNSQRVIVPSGTWDKSDFSYDSGGGLSLPNSFDYMINTNYMDSNKNGVSLGLYNTIQPVSEYDKEYNWQLEGVASDNINNSGTGVFSTLLNSGIFGQTPTCFYSPSPGQSPKCTYTGTTDFHYAQIPDLDPGNYDDGGSGDATGNGYPGVKIYSFNDEANPKYGYLDMGLAKAMQLPYRPPRTYYNPNGYSDKTWQKVSDHLFTKFGNDYEKLWTGGSSDYYESSDDRGTHTAIYDLYNGSITDLAKGGYPTSTPPTPSHHYYGNLQIDKVAKQADGSTKSLPGATFVVWKAPSQDASDGGCANSSVPSDPLMSAVSGTYRTTTAHDPSTWPDATPHGDGLVKFVDIPMDGPGTEKFCFAETSAPDGYQIDSHHYWANLTAGADGKMGDAVPWTDSGSVPNNLEQYTITDTVKTPSNTGSITIGKYTASLVTTLNGTSLKWSNQLTGRVEGTDDNVKAVSNLPSASTAIALGGSQWTVTSIPDTGASTSTTVDDCKQAPCTANATGIYDSDPTSGVLKLDNLPKGIYTITEKTAPTGATLNNHSFTIYIEPSNYPYISLAPNNVKMDWVIAFGDKTAFNPTGPSLPFAGGLSTLIFQLVALTLLVLASLLAIKLWIKRKGGQRVK